MADMTSALFLLSILSAAHVVAPLPNDESCLVCHFPENLEELCGNLLNLPGVNYTTNNGVFNPKLEGDRADAWSNVLDTCNGRAAAKRSSHCCNIDGKMHCAPGGLICLDVAGVFNYIIMMTMNDMPQFVQVNYLSGGCHPSGSPHYEGMAVDMQILPSNNVDRFRSVCEGNFRGEFSHSGDDRMACFHPAPPNIHS